MPPAPRLRVQAQKRRLRSVIGAITIDQSSRVGILPDFEATLGRKLEINKASSASRSCTEDESRPFGIALHAPEDTLFTNHAGDRLSRKQIYRVVDDAADRLALEGIHPHLLGHTMASLLRKPGGAPGYDSGSAWPRVHRHHRDVCARGSLGPGRAAEKLGDL